MKGYKLFTFLFICFYLSGIIISCDKNDSPQESEIPGGGDNTGSGGQHPSQKQERLISQMYIPDVNFSIYRIIYDEFNRPVSISGIWNVIQISYDPLELVIGDYEDVYGHPYIKNVYNWTEIKTNPEGYITYASIEETNYSREGEIELVDNYFQTFEYNAGFLVKNIESYFDGHEDFITNYIWEDNQLRKVNISYMENNEDIYQLFYENAPENVHNLWVPFWLDGEAVIFMTNLIGKAPEFLPTLELVGPYELPCEYSYNLDDEGYVTFLNWGENKIGVDYTNVRSSNSNSGNTLKDKKIYKQGFPLFKSKKKFFDKVK